MRPHPKSHTEMSQSPASGIVVWTTGLSGAGKTTLCTRVAESLALQGRSVTVLDGDELRASLSLDLGFSYEDRLTHAHRVARLAARQAELYSVVLVATISPYEAMRTIARTACRNFLELYVRADLQTCIDRDPKGLYRRAMEGLVADFTGVSAPYEAPFAPDIVCDTTRYTVAECVSVLLECIESHVQAEVMRATS